MRSTIKNIAITIICAAILIPATSCVKDQFTVPSPGANVDPTGVHATMTIKAFKQKFFTGAVVNGTLPVLVDSDVVLTGIINADDKSGNFYKVLSFQDTTGGLQIKIAGSNLFYDYPIGRRIWIKMKGLYIFNYGGTFEIGGYIDLSGTFPSVGGIATTDLNNVIIKGQWGLQVPVSKVTIRDLVYANYIDKQSMLYQIDSVEFNHYDTSGTYSNALTKGSVNIGLEDCPGFTMVVRTSGYAGFAMQKPASGRGTILGIFTYYTFSSSGNLQLTIRDTTDVRFYNPRCH